MLQAFMITSNHPKRGAPFGFDVLGRTPKAGNFGDEGYAFKQNRKPSDAAASEGSF
ncbi:hypothetical protein [Beijerinckia indica]|uniref:hypothetical protein n=1 Tax=Beijerinckia indica TaxID=533 RepID=UPI00130543DE|nr:hypothetical protein [Beijerinckia indica]